MFARSAPRLFSSMANRARTGPLHATNCEQFYAFLLRREKLRWEDERRIKLKAEKDQEYWSRVGLRVVLTFYGGLFAAFLAVPIGFALGK